VALVPEGIEEGLVPTSAGVCDEEEEEGNEDLWGERAAAREVLLPGPKSRRFVIGQQAGDQTIMFIDSAGAGMEIAFRILCRSCRDLQKMWKFVS
jgi:hypothetical protein